MQINLHDIQSVTVSKPEEYSDTDLPGYYVDITIKTTRGDRVEITLHQCGETTEFIDNDGLFVKPKEVKESELIDLVELARQVAVRPAMNFMMEKK